MSLFQFYYNIEINLHLLLGRAGKHRDKMAPLAESEIDKAEPVYEEVTGVTLNDDELVIKVRQGERKSSWYRCIKDIF